MMNQSIEKEHTYLRPVDILIPNTDLPKFATDFTLFLLGFLLKFLTIYTSLGFKLKMLFIYAEAIGKVRIYTNIANTTTTKWFPLFYNNRPEISELSPVIQHALIMFSLLFIMATFRLIYYFHEQLIDLMTRFLLYVFDVDDLDDLVYHTTIVPVNPDDVNDFDDSDDSDESDGSNYGDGSDVDDSSNNDRGPDNGDDPIGYTFYIYTDDEDYDGDDEENERDDDFELIDYALRFVYNERMSSGYYSEFLAFNEYPDYGNYPANSDDEIFSDSDDNRNDRTVHDNNGHSDVTNPDDHDFVFFGNNNNTI